MKKSIIALIHLLCWLLWIVSDWWDLYQNKQILTEVKSNLSVETHLLFIAIAYKIICIIAFYGLVSLVALLLFKKRKYVKGILSFIVLLAVIPIIRYIIEFQLLKPLLNWDNYSNNTNFQWSWFTYNAIIYHSRYFIWGLIYYLIIDHFRKINLQKSLEQEKIAAELAFLKSQTNPHFLFNTINDIYALTIQKSDAAPNALLKLSNMLRYTLHESTAPTVPLEKELNYLQDYIELQRIGFKGNVFVEVKIEGDITNRQIESLLLISFIENAFKHGVFNDVSKPIKINCQIEKDRFLFSCENYIKLQQKDKMGGIGLQNVRRRLELLYPEKHSLQIETCCDIYKCQLILF